MQTLIKPKTRMEAYNFVMKLRKEEGLGRRKIYKLLQETGYNDISASSVSYWLYNNGKPRLKEFSEEAKKLTAEKAYILGVIGPGDGYIVDEKYEIALSVIDEDFAQKFKNYLEKIYGLKCRKYITEPMGFGKKMVYNISLYSIKLVEDLKRYGVEFKEGKWRVPNAIKNSSLHIQAPYIAGFADSQGCVHKREILLASQNKKGLGEIKKLLINFDIRSSILKRKDTCILSIHSRSSLENFYNSIGFSILRKQKKLKEVLVNYQRHYILTEDIDKFIPQIKRYINLGYPKTKIAKMLGISCTAVNNRLEKWRDG